MSPGAQSGINTRNLFILWGVIMTISLLISALSSSNNKISNSITLESKYTYLQECIQNCG